VEGRDRNKVIAGLVQEAYKRGKHTVVLLERVQHLKDLSNLLKVPHFTLYGEKHVDERVESTKIFESGGIRVILANKIFKKGINIKRLDLIIDGAAMKSKNDSQQKYGRGVRLCDGKVGLIYIDIADKGNRFEKAAKSRRTALKRLGVPVYMVSSDIGAQRILELAEERLMELINDKGKMEGSPQGILPGFELGEGSKKQRRTRGA
jgi:superfamily II DNA or RNA helicase